MSDFICNPLSGFDHTVVRKYAMTGVTRDGSPTNEKCPKCGSAIVYNGNYFCKNWTFHVDDKPVDTEAGECDWALPHPQTELVDKQICFRLVGYWEEGEKIVNGEPSWIIHRKEPK